MALRTRKNNNEDLLQGFGPVVESPPVPSPL